MLFVLGAGSYSPAQQLTDETLRSLGVAVPNGAGVAVRGTTANLEHLKAFKNSDLKETMKNVVETCTDMGERAARQAIERAQIPIEEIGLVIGDCSTPIEVTPAEGQRIAGRLGLRVPAYDIYTTSGVCPAHISILSDWKKERLPKYILCVSTNAPTQRIPYGDAHADSWTYSDGASACVLSVDSERGLEVVYTDFRVEPFRAPRYELDTLGYLVGQKNDEAVLRGQIDKVFGKMLDKLSVKEHMARMKFFWSLQDGAIPQETLRNHGADPSQVINQFSKRGDMLGTSPFYALAEQWDALRDGEYLAVILADGGMNYGSTVFRVRGRL